jgi:predicted phosphodiesterase
MNYSFQRKLIIAGLLLLSSFLEAEQVDLVILTGDIVTGKPVIRSWEVLTDLLISYKVPYTITFGNHDGEAETSREEMWNCRGRSRTFLVNCAIFAGN